MKVQIHHMRPPGAPLSLVTLLTYSPPVTLREHPVSHSGLLRRRALWRNPRRFVDFSVSERNRAHRLALRNYLHGDVRTYRVFSGLYAEQAPEASEERILRAYVALRVCEVGDYWGDGKDLVLSAKGFVPSDMGAELE